MDEEEQYKVALFLRKSNYEFLNIIGVSTVIKEKQVKTDSAKLIVDIADIFSSGAIYLKDKDNKSEAFWSIDFSTTKDSPIPKGFKESSTSFKGKEPSFDTIGYSNEEAEIRKNYVFSDVWNSDSIKNLKEEFTKWAKEGEIEFFTSDVRKLNDKATGFTVWKKHKEHWYHFSIAWNFNKVWQYEQAALWGLHFPFVDRYIQHQYLEVGNLIPVAVEELRILNYINTKSDIFKNRGYETRRLPDSLFIRHILCPSCSPLSTKEVNEMYQGERKIDINQKDIETLARGSWRDRWGSWIISAEKREATDPIKKYREWCEESLTKAPSSARLINTKAFCFAKEFRTGEERLKYDGRTKFTREQLRDSYVSLGIDKFKDYESNTLIRDLGGLELRKNQDAFTDAYEKYCNTEGSKAIYELDYSKYFTRCSFKN
ncbi:hypothetical protein A6V39_01240 [Candidatus Mycoplasma haematobovis]|uniref:Uncharacterized protein n=1 Tax=Candidatus Mycoplasma haematobovis TaxID=432608 RepID=A0A1A9QEK7_9MOLU|nr:hypothetical protein [Candidatus Mycoplasma haematobovis]OAL10678.1 hypothetical protein A6V39_01240 [Candidatus Mycoplasma haematobovis]